jgi:hypothetical protein
MCCVSSSFLVFCSQYVLYLCFRDAVTARNQGQWFAAVSVGISSIHPVGGGEDPCISFLDHSSNLFHLHIHVICQSKWLCCLRRGSASAYLLGGLWVQITSGNECLSLVSVVCCQVEVSALSQSLVWRSRTEFAVSECDSRTSTLGRSRRIRAM